jgi:probable rRNA maturation factor
MIAEIEIANATRQEINNRLVKTIAGKVLAGELGQECGGKIEISVAFVSAQKIRSLNKKWRKIDCVTDVLSFAEGDFLKRLAAKNLQPHEFLGEIIICLEQVAKDAKVQKTSFQQELMWAITHGALHLFGYDHETTKKDAILMRQKEQYYMRKVFNDDCSVRLKYEIQSGEVRPRPSRGLTS